MALRPRFEAALPLALKAALASAIGFCAVAVVCVGCRVATVPPVAEDVEQITTSVFANEPDDAPKTVGTKICQPVDWRTCRVTWFDADGTKHCTSNIQFCRSDGYGWRACGDRDAAAPVEQATEVDAGADQTTDDDDGGSDTPTDVVR